MTRKQYAQKNDANKGAHAQNSPLPTRGSNHVGMRQFNERVVLQALRLHGSMPKAELARLTGLSAQTIGLIAARLDEDELLIRHDRVRGRIGQPSIPLALNPDGAFSIGIKIGRRSTDLMLVDFNGKVRQRQSIRYDFPAAASLLPAIREGINALRESLGDLDARLVGVGVAAPFLLGGWHRLLGLSEAQATQWNQLNLAAEVQAMTELPVSFARDTSAACIAELVMGRGHDLKSFLYLFVDTFIGGGLVINSQPRLGVHGNAGAIASLPMSVVNGRQTPDQLVTHASLWELEQRLSGAGLDPSAAYDERALQAPFEVETRAWIASAAPALAHCITSGMAFLDVDAVVIDGSVCAPLLQALIAATRDAMQGYDWEGLWQASITAGSVGADAGALGGALLPMHANFAPDSELFLKVGG